MKQNMPHKDSGSAGFSLPPESEAIFQKWLEDRASHANEFPLLSKLAHARLRRYPHLTQEMREDLLQREG